MKRISVLTLLVVAFAASRASAITQTYNAFLDGLQEVGPNASPGTGIGSVLLDTVALTITVDENWSGLTSPATASHIHGPAAPGFNAAVLFPLSGVPNATSGAIPTQGFSITAAQMTQFQANQMYFNVHTSNFPGGEIRGQILLSDVPEPATFTLVALAGGCFLLRRRRVRT